MKYFSDLQKVGDKVEDLLNFVTVAINEHKSTDLYKEAEIAYEYFKKRNVTITKFQKWLYKMTGEPVIDNMSANYKFCNSFFPIFVRQENSYLLGDGVTFENEETKEKLGGNEFDKDIYTAGEYALWGGVSFVFFNFDRIDVFKVTEFVPIIDEEDGALHAGIRFWQVQSDKPLRATLYEEDGFTELIYRHGKGEILREKQAYKQIVKESIADGVEIYDGENYPNFPIVPLWANNEHQSELTGLRSKIDGYDLIQSGFANDLDDASQIYWIINNAGGMDEVDLAKFLDQIRRVKAATVDEDGAKAEAHTLEVPYQARQAGLADLRDSLYRDAMALDTDKISAGNITATAIEAAYENLELKCDGYETCVTECILGLLSLIGVDDTPTYHRRKTTNKAETTSMILSAAQYLDDETILNLLPFINVDTVQDILDKRNAEEAERYVPDEEDMNDGQGEGEDGQTTEQNQQEDKGNLQEQF